MADSLRHRGPDDSGEWMDDDVGVALCHRRLSVVDLSTEGHQPMVSHSGRFVITYNGEVYNFRALRQSLEKLGHAFRGHSDTEILLTAIEEWGLDLALSHFIGMFAFALWDREKRQLSLVRDRLGIKPLYYGLVGRVFLFGSELKALRAFPGFRREIDRGSVALLMRHSAIPAPWSIFRDVYKLLPGNILTISGEGGMGKPDVRCYWSANEIANNGKLNQFPGSTEEAVESLDVLLRDAVALQTVADVSLGAFLSGGYDSSTVVALMQQQSGRPVKTFSIGFQESSYDEAEHAKLIAVHLGTDHTQLYVTPDEAMEVIPGLPVFFDEPFSDSSQIPTFLVSRMAREHVTVSLSGDGGDELFAGYNRYMWAPRFWSKIRALPVGLRAFMAKLINSVSPYAWNRLIDQITRLLPSAFQIRFPGDKLYKIARVLGADSPDALYRALVSHWDEPHALVLGATEPLTALTDPVRKSQLSDFTERMMATDTISYLPDDILTKVDRASMAVGLEARVPLLDHRVAEFAWSLPLHMKVNCWQGKWILRQVLYKYVPRGLVDRPKMGFGVPIDSWLRGPLREWAEDLLTEERLRRDGFFDPQPIREKWREHLSRKRNWQHHLWDVLMFQAWLDAQG